MKCPKCESDNTQRLQVAFHSGTQNISTTSNSAGVGIGSGGRIGFGGGVTKTSGQSQSVLAAACSPPAKRSDKGPSFGLILGLLPCQLFLLLGSLSSSGFLATLGLVFGTLIVFSPIWGISGYLLHSRSKYNKQVWPSLYQHWAESWICHKCGDVYQQK